MRIETPRVKAWLIGDPHLGRNFSNGTPLSRRGEREKMQRAQFQQELRTPDVDAVIMVGDLFDKPFVPLPILSQAIEDAIAAAKERPEVQFFYMAGNHDLSRQLGTMGAWQVFELAISWLENVTVVNNCHFFGDIQMFGWRWDMTAAEQVVENHWGPAVQASIGHWDLIDFGGDTSHMVPVKELLAENPNMVLYSGHYHLEGTFQVDGVDVHCTGSMQPYTHAEDPEGNLYVTLTAEEALERDDLADKCVRILLEPGEPMPEIECLQLTSKRGKGEVEEIDIDAIGSATFNVEETLNHELDQNEVPDEVRTYIKENLGALA